MENIGSFLRKFKNRASEEINNLVFIIETIKKHTGISLEMKDISISHGVMRLKLSSVQKNVVYIKKNQILKDLEVLQGRKVSDIQ